MAVTVPDLTRSSALDLFRGFGIALRGLGLVFSTPALSRLALGVAFVTVVTLVGLVAGLWFAVPALVGWAWTPPDTWWGASLFTVAEILVFLLFLVAGANTLPMMLAAPLMDPISIATERLLGVEVRSEEGVKRMVTEVVHAVANGLVRLVVLALGQLLLLLVLLIPGLGGPLWSVLSWTWTALWLSAAHLDVPMARHLYPFDQELSVLRRRPLLCVGFGAAVALMLWVPVLNCFFVPAAVISSTLLFRGLVAAGLLPAPKESGAPG
ncbi:MAG TPA: EI24 domain-containing protein [Myxococcales bacterium]|jgi:CysZ protein